MPDDSGVLSLWEDRELEDDADELLEIGGPTLSILWAADSLLGG